MKVTMSLCVQVLSDTGILAGKTRVLVTHAHWTLPQVSRVIVMQEGRIYSNSPFADIENDAVVQQLTAHSHDNQQDDEVVTRDRRTSSVTSEQGDEDGALVSEEANSKSNVGIRTYLNYLRAGGGIAWFCGILFFFVLTQIVRVGCDYWISVWSTDVLEWDQVDYFFGYLALVGLYTIMIVIRTIVFTIAMLTASSKLHDSMFAKVLRAPMRFFWETPTGRVVNRFSKDIDTLDKLLVKGATDMLNFMIVAIGAFISVAVFVPFSLFIVPVLAVAFWASVRFF